MVQNKNVITEKGEEKILTIFAMISLIILGMIIADIGNFTYYDCEVICQEPSEELKNHCGENDCGEPYKSIINCPKSQILYWYNEETGKITTEFCEQGETKELN